jgi:anti-sigma regulatory factor (Ser/Thr protein kinase)
MVDVCILLGVHQPEGTRGHLVALDSIRPCRHRFGCTVGDWARRHAAHTSVAARCHRRRCRTRGSWGDDRSYRFTSAGALADRGSGRAGDAVTGFRGDLQQHGITASVKLQEDLPKIVAHKGQLHEVFTNLIRNAIEAMDADKNNHQVLQVSSGRHDDDKIILSIEDSGPGIDPKHAENIFDAFITTKSHGMGLGLALCRMIIERHSGELSVSPAHPRGSIFRIVLPIFARDKKIA